MNERFLPKDMLSYKELEEILVNLGKEYFPKKKFENFKEDNLLTMFFVSCLLGFEEKPLLETNGDIFRVLMIPPFSSSSLIKIHSLENHIQLTFIKEKKTRIKLLGKSQWQNVENYFEKILFWELASYEELIQLKDGTVVLQNDGEMYLLEGKKNNQYHAIKRSLSKLGKECYEYLKNFMPSNGSEI